MSGGDVIRIILIGGVFIAIEVWRVRKRSRLIAAGDFVGLERYYRIRGAVGAAVCLLAAPFLALTGLSMILVIGALVLGLGNLAMAIRAKSWVKMTLPNECPNCNHNLQGVTGTHCPTCGETL